MIKRALVAIGAILVLGIAYNAVSTLLSGDESKPAKQGRKEVPKEPWSGEARHVYNTTLMRRGQLIALYTVDFKQLNLARASAVAKLAADVSSSRPSWLRPRRFFAYQYGSKRSYRPHVSERIEGSKAVIELRFRGLPTAALGPTCRSKRPPADPIYLRMPGLPGGEVAIAITAPQPPAGACLADPEAIAAAERARMLAQSGAVLAKPKVKGRRIAVRGRVQANGLEEVRLELGRQGRFPQSRSLRARRGPFFARLRAPRKGRFTLRVVIRDPNAGTFTPKRARRTIKVR